VEHRLVVRAMHYGNFEVHVHEGSRLKANREQLTPVISEFCCMIAVWASSVADL
jgi:hypothetical protein